MPALNNRNSPVGPPNWLMPRLPPNTLEIADGPTPPKPPLLPAPDPRPVSERAQVDQRDPAERDHEERGRTGQAVHHARAPRTGRREQVGQPQAGHDEPRGQQLGEEPEAATR